MPYDERNFGKIAKTAGILVGGIALIGVATWLITKDKKIPYGSLSKDPYITYNGVSISERDLYDEYRYSSLNLLEKMMLESLYADELTKVNLTVNGDDHIYIKEKILKSVFGTDEIDEINEKKASQPVETAQAVKRYLDNQYLDSRVDLGLTSTGEVLVDEFLAHLETTGDNSLIAANKLLAAQFNYSLAKEIEKDDVSDQDIEDYLDDTLLDYQYNDRKINAVIIKTSSEALLNAAIREAGFTYDPSGPEEFSGSTLQNYIDVYNVLNRHDTLANGESREYTYDDVKGILGTQTAEEVFTGEYNASAANYDSGNADHTAEKLYDGMYIKKRQSTSGSWIMFVDSIPAVRTIGDLTEQEKEDIKNEIYKQRVTDAVIQAEYTSLLNDSNVKMYDPVLEDLFDSKYYSIEFEPTKKNKSNDLVASFNGTDISVDSFFEYCNKSYGAFMKAQVLISAIVEDDSRYNDLVSKDDKKTIETNLKNEVSAFKAGSLIEQGYNPEYMDEKAYLRKKYGVDKLKYAVEENVNRIKVSAYYSDFTKRYENYADKATSFINTARNDYFSISIEELVASQDANGDGISDSNKTNYNGSDVYNTFAMGITYDGEDPLSTIVSTFNSITYYYTSTNDTVNNEGNYTSFEEHTGRSEAQIKSYIKTNNGILKHNASSVINNFNTTLSTKLLNEIKSQYDTQYYSNDRTGELERKSSKVTFELFDEYGTHLVIGSSPTEIVSFTSDDSDYTAASNGDVTAEYMQTYLDDIYDTETIPEDVTTAMNTYYSPLSSRLSSNAGIQIVSYNLLNSSTGDGALSAEDKSYINKAIEVAFRQIDGYREIPDGHVFDNTGAEKFWDTFWTPLT